MFQRRGFLAASWERLKSWEGFLLLLLLGIIFVNSRLTPAYLTFENQVNLFQLYIEKIIVTLAMTFIIINGEIDLSVASVMGLAAGTLAILFEHGVPVPLALLAGLTVGALCGLMNGFWIAHVGLPSLVVTLAGLIGYRGLVYVLVEDRSITGFPDWLNRLGQQPLVGPFTLAMLIFFALVIVAVIVLQYSGFGRYVYTIGNSKEVARYSGVQVRWIKMILFVTSGIVAALAGLLYTSRLGAMRGSTADGFELEIITMVLLGGVSIFGGKGSIWGVLLSILIILNLHNGMGLAGLSGHLRAGVIGILLILSVLVPNMVEKVRDSLRRQRRLRRSVAAVEVGEAG